MAGIPFSAFAKNLIGWAKRAPETLRRGSIEGAQKCIPVLQQLTTEVGAVATGRFRDGWFVVTKGLRFPEFINMAPWAGYVEYGRKPGRAPPHDAIVRWVEIKFRIGGAEAERMAWAIGQKIAAQGIKGRYILKRARPKIIAIVALEAVGELRKDWSKK